MKKIKSGKIGFIISFILSLFLSESLNAQKFSNTTIYRDFPSEKYIRLNYDNDVFTDSDHGYTQGITLEVVHPTFKRNPLNILFFNKNSEKKYGLSIEHLTFTPSVIGNDKIQFGDQPFAAALYIKSFQINDNFQKKSRFYSSFLIGVLGPIALGKEGQSFVHRIIDNLEPIGWKNQITNDLLLNYEINYEKQIINFQDFLLINSDTGFRLGSLYTDLSAGLSGMIGLIKTPSSLKSRNSKFQIYLYANPKLYAVAFDASLQGGLFNKKSIYVIDSSDIEKIKSRIDFGITLKTGGFYFEYTRTQISKEYTTGGKETWGGIRLGVRI
ncbi:lipid A deacylase LpxR family protein [Christiangramia sp. SM2212]|uniref:Lipid A deacylase LpxR family protein n=1 Tax=Christiangramia sediminicola TaxID=3073267 RepID=A0ABU1EPM9_9FLAO|nr:lipid A deacylase LpxR family protein [Christiangramia sp. SM2212]MDR5590344.1 lipid A deacylase LpxR family protein [Christiangramia sp. SM2212]